MINKFRSYFKNLSPNYWLNLGMSLSLMIILLFYIGQIVFYINHGSICQHYGSDYCAFWSAGKIINLENFRDIYNSNKLFQYQQDIYNPNNLSTDLFRAIEVPYLPVFIIPFGLFSLLSPIGSYLAWTFINIIGFILYLRFFTKKLACRGHSFKIILAFLLSFPLFINLQEGQLNIWLMICTGEYLRAFISEKPVNAGLWLGGLLLKPQLLILILPLIIIKHSLRVFKGFLLSSLGIFIVSFLLVGIEGFLDLTKILLESAAGRATSAAYAMMNWRMLGEHIASLTSQETGNIIMIAGSLITAGIAIYIFKKKISDPNQFMIASLGIFAATCAVTWHAHMHMSIIIIPPMLYLLMKDQFNKELFTIWVLIPALCHISGLVLLFILEFNHITVDNRQLMGFFRGSPVFLLNLVLLGWAISQYKRVHNSNVPARI